MLKLESMITLNQFEQSLNAKIGDEEQTEIGDLIADGNPSPEDIMIKDERNKLVYGLLDEIPLEVTYYIKDYFGLGTNKTLDYLEIGVKYGKKPSYVKNMVEKHLSWLRRKNNNSKEFFFPTNGKEIRWKNELENNLL